MQGLYSDYTVWQCAVINEYINDIMFNDNDMICLHVFQLPTAWFVTKKSYSWPAKWDWPQFRHRSWWHPRANSQLAPVGTNGWPRSNGPCKQPWPEPLQRSWKLTQCNISQHHCSVKSGKLIWGQITEHSADPSTSWESAYLNRVLIFPAKCPVHDSLQLGCWAAADHIGFQSFLGHLCQPG